MPDISMLSGTALPCVRSMQVENQIKQHCSWIEDQLRAIVTSPQAHPLTLKGPQSGASAMAKPKMRESELIATVKSLQRALDKQQKEMQSMVASSKYMQVIRRNVPISLLPYCTGHTPVKRLTPCRRSQHTRPPRRS